MAFIKVGNKVLKCGGKVVTNDLVLFVKLGNDRKTLSVVPSKEIASTLTRYMLVLTPDSGSATEVNIGNTGTYNLSSLHGTVQDGKYTLSVYAVLSSGNTSTFGDIEYYVLAPCEAMTLRFQFSQEGYDPSVLGDTKWNKGSWTHVIDNVWDWTYSNTSWATAFGGGGTGVAGAFCDETNAVKVIDAGDTSTVTNFSRFFQNCTAVTEVRALDTSGATTATLMFSHCEALTNVCDLDLSNSSNNAGIFQCAYELREAPQIQFSTTKAYSCQNFFAQCALLKRIPAYDLRRCTNTASFLSGVVSNVSKVMSIEEVPELPLDNVTNMTSMFWNCRHVRQISLANVSKVTLMPNAFFCCESLETVPWMELGNVTNMENTFGYCLMLKGIPPYDIHSCTILNGTFQRCPSIRHLPSLDTGNVTDFANCCNGTDAGVCNLEEIPDWDFSNGTSFSCAFKNNIQLTTISGVRVPAATNVDQMFRGCRKVETGITELYEHLSTKEVSVTSHSRTFENTGADSVPGAAELAQIPADWGGTKST